MRGTNHFATAERYVKRAEDAWFSVLNGDTENEQQDLTKLHYYLQLASQHTLLAQIQTQQDGFGSVGRMADAVVSEAAKNTNEENA